MQWYKWPCSGPARPTVLRQDLLCRLSLATTKRASPQFQTWRSYASEMRLIDLVLGYSKFEPPRSFPYCPAMHPSTRATGHRRSGSESVVLILLCLSPTLSDFRVRIHVVDYLQTKPLRWNERVRLRKSRRAALFTLRSPGKQIMKLQEVNVSLSTAARWIRTQS